METTVRFKPSQWSYAPLYLTALFFIAAVYFTHNFWWLLPLPLYFMKYLQLAAWSYEISPDGDIITQEKGVLTRRRVDVHTFRIKSIQVVRPAYFQFIGLANVIVLTSEPFMPVLTFYAISESGTPHADAICEYLRASATYWRAQKGVKETDFHSF